MSHTLTFLCSRKGYNGGPELLQSEKYLMQAITEKQGLDQAIPVRIEINVADLDNIRITIYG
jgi:hypothetical protein